MEAEEAAEEEVEVVGKGAVAKAHSGQREAAASWGMC